MAGFQIKLKGKGINKNNKNNNPTKISLTESKKKLLKKETTVKKSNALIDSEPENDDDDHTVFISSFGNNSSVGDRSIGGNKMQQKLTIVPDNLQAKITRQKPYIPNQEQKQPINDIEEEKLQFGLNKIAPEKKVDKDLVESIENNPLQSVEERARLSLLSGEPVVDTSGMSIPIGNELENDIREIPEEATADEYANVPVEEFGAALLRGMGWKSDKKRNVSKKVDINSKKGLFLGIGAKVVEPEIMEELVAKKGVKFQVPLVKKE